jgi:hypothetical protein
VSAQAQRAYEAYWSAFYGPDAVRRSIPWDDSSDKSKEAWRAAVAAAVDSPERTKESLTEAQVRMVEEMGTVEIAKRLKAMMPENRAFILMTAEYGPGGNLAYVATMDREDAIRCVREWLKKQGAL